MRVTIAKVFASNVLSAALGFLTSVMLARLLPLSEYGSISFIFSLVIIISTIVDFGFSNAAVIVHNRFERELGHAAMDFTNRTFARVVLGSVPAVLAVLLLIEPLFELHRVETGVVLLSSVSYTIYRYLVSLRQARGEWTRYNVLLVLNNALRLLLVGAFLLILHRSLHRLGAYPSSLLGYTASGVVACLVVVALSWPLLRASTPAAGGEAGLAGALKGVVIHIGLANVFIVIALRIDSVIIRESLGNDALGIYSAANSLALAFPLLTGSMMNVLLKEASATGAAEFLSRVVRGQVRLLPWALGLMGAAVALSKPLILLLFGARFGASVDVFRILLVGYIGGVLFVPLESYFYAHDQRVVTQIKLLQVVVLVGFALVLVRSWGLTGVAVSVVLSRIATWGMIAWQTWRAWRRTRGRPAESGTGIAEDPFAGI